MISKYSIGLYNFFLKLFKMDWINQLPKVNNKFKFQLFGRNVENLNSCYSNIEKFDPNNTRIMNQNTFNLYLNSFGVYLTTQEIRIIK